MLNRKEKFVLAVWAVWFALLFGTPYFRLQPYSGALASGIYAYCAMGFLLGLVAYKLVSRLMPAMIRPISFVAAICGVILSIVAFAYEWLALSAYFAGRFEVLPLHQFRLLMQWEKPLICLTGCCCAFFGAVVLLEPSPRADGKEDACEKTGREIDENDAGGFSVLIAIAALFVCGLLETAAAALFFPFVAKDADALIVKVQTSALLLWVVPLASFVVAVLCAAFSRIANRNLPTSKRKIAGTAILASFPVGLLTWNVVTRAIPVGGMNLAGHVGVSVVACVFFVLSACAVFAVLRFSQKKAEDAGAQVEGGPQSGLLEAWLEIAAKYELSPREAEVAALTASGETSGSIAAKLQIKAPTVRSYQQRVYRKANISSREELLALGLAESTAKNGAKSESSSDFRQSDPGACSMKTCRIVLIIGTVLTAALFIPPGEISSWGVGRPVLLGAGLGFALSGAALLALDVTDARFQGNTRTLTVLAGTAFCQRHSLRPIKPFWLSGSGLALGALADFLRPPLREA